MVKALVILMFPVIAHAQFFSGNDLHERLNSENVVNRSIGLGFVAGIVDAHIDVSICAPESVQLRQAVDIVKQWLTNNPDKRHLSAALLTYHALRQVWPCKKESLMPGGKS